MKGLDRLLELQEADTAIDRLSARRERLEAGTALDEARQQTATVEDRVGEVRLSLDSVKREQARLEGEAETLELKIADEEKRLYDGSVVNPKELSSIQAEVANLRARKGRIEDDVLVQMERREELEGRLPPLEEELFAARSRAGEVESSQTRELEEASAELTAARERRDGLTGEIDAELLELYEDLRAQKRGVGAAALIDGICQGCHQKLSAAELDRIKRTEGIRRCEYCRRILVLA